MISRYLVHLPLKDYIYWWVMGVFQYFGALFSSCINIYLIFVFILSRILPSLSSDTETVKHFYNLMLKYHWVILIKTKAFTKYLNTTNC